VSYFVQLSIVVVVATALQSTGRGLLREGTRWDAAGHRQAAAADASLW